VVVDKPLAPRATEARALVEHAARAGLLLTVFQNRRWDGDFLTVQGLIREGLVGQVTRFESRFERWRPEIRPGAWRERPAPDEAGGLLFDLGSHLIDQAAVLFGRPLAVFAELNRRRVGAEVDDDAFVALTHADGVRAHLWMSSVAAIQGPRFRVLGSAGAYEKYGLDPQEAALSAGERPGDAAWGTEPPEDWGTLKVGDDTRALETVPGNYPAFYEQVAEAIRTSGAPPVDPMDAAGVLEIIEAARRSAESGTAVSPNET
jgi:predicted dehydrogenase